MRTDVEVDAAPVDPNACSRLVKGSHDILCNSKCQTHEQTIHSQA